ncbi:unnamed protein product, partial [Gongylonema pulchrum]|uniref:Bestrophin homolog n=1 Tax=Gongylonema pulchrum TaxID=637853 RepID=A0A183E5F5_9BILA
ANKIIRINVVFRAFELFANYFQKGADEIPLAFILGFFVNVIIQRWTDAFKNMGYLENQAIHISSMILGDDERSRLFRRTIARYLCLAQVLVFRDISVQVRKRFPTYESIVKAGFLLEAEKEKLEGYDLNFDKYWVPINWSFALVIKARQEGLIFAENYAIKITDTAMYIVDEAHHDLPPLQKDQFWLRGEVEPMYSKDAAALPINPLIGSAVRAASRDSTDEPPEPEMVAREPYKYPEGLSRM